MQSQTHYPLKDTLENIEFQKLFFYFKFSHLNLFKILYPFTEGFYKFFPLENLKANKYQKYKSAKPIVKLGKPIRKVCIRIRNNILCKKN